MSARFSVKRVPRVGVRGIKNVEDHGANALDACWYRIIDRATGDFVGGRHAEQTGAHDECERLNNRTRCA
ncbi:hypothetical protein [Pseudomonas taiwanensis]|uniref:hypothetical protein n=1 Tax=Pseudomonas taiwanensis TaxID=470150 RepID=UPI0015C0A63B|nr:hypothetical protein [Pseudomonas taiwanensis]